MTNTNYNKMSMKQHNETAELLERIDEIIPQPSEIEELVEETPEPMIEGMVTGCDQMYVRSEASIDSEPLGIIKRDAILRIYESESTNDFYSVCTETGLTGFCVKKFISIL